jgi:selenoprotein W-related protein
VSLAENLLSDFANQIESIRLIPSDGGRFEVTVNRELVFSKLQSKRRAEIAEINALIRKILNQ